jgi:hypothetical protein
VSLSLAAVDVVACGGVSAAQAWHAHVFVCARSQRSFNADKWKQTYVDFIARVRAALGKDVHIFLGCGPMSQTVFFCPLVLQLEAQLSATDPHISSLDFRMPGMVLIGCLDHPNWCVV